MSSTKKITLKSSDGEVFEVEAAVAAMFSAVAPTADKDSASTEITISNVRGKILAKIIEYCEKQVHAAAATDEVDCDSLKNWEAEFINLDAETLSDLYYAAEDLKMEHIVDLVIIGLQNAMKNKTVEEIREFFNIENDFTPEEEEEVRRETRMGF